MVAPLRALSAFALLAGAAAQLCNPVKDPFCCRDKKTRCAQVVFGSCLITAVKWLSRELSSYPIRRARPVERFGIRGTIPLSRDASL